MALTKIPPSGINIAALTNELGGGTTVYATIAGLPLSGNDPGSMAFVSENNRLYIWNGTGWFNIALINTSPTITSGPNVSYELDTTGTPTIITLAAQDPEGIPVTWSYQVTSGTLGNTATIAQNSNVFTITPSTSSADAGTFGITFTASDGVNLATATSSFELTFSIPIGSAYGGGFYAGEISTGANGVATHHLVVGPRSSAQSGTRLQYKTTLGATTGTGSVIDGPANTAACVADATTHPAAIFCNDLVVGGYSDWYLPAKNELEVCYYNLKPSQDLNNTSYGINPNAVPIRGSNYTSSGTPIQTTAQAFQAGGSEAFGSSGFPDYCYWSSTQYGANTNLAHYARFHTGEFSFAGKTGQYNVRAVRRVAV